MCGQVYLLHLSDTRPLNYQNSFLSACILCKYKCRAFYLIIKSKHCVNIKSTFRMKNRMVFVFVFDIQVTILVSSSRSTLVVERVFCPCISLCNDLLEMYIKFRLLETIALQRPHVTQMLKNLLKHHPTYFVL